MSEFRNFGNSEFSVKNWYCQRLMILPAVYGKKSCKGVRDCTRCLNIFSQLKKKKKKKKLLQWRSNETNFLSFEQNNIFQTGVIKHRNVFCFIDDSLLFSSDEKQNFVGIASSFNDRFLFVPDNSSWRKNAIKEQLGETWPPDAKFFHKIMQDECRLWTRREKNCQLF